MAQPDQKHPWEQRDDEGPKAYESFQAFLTIGPSRTIKAVAAALGLKNQTLRKRSMQYDWFNRADAWDKTQKLANHPVGTPLNEAQRLEQEQLKAWEAVRALGTVSIARILQQANVDKAPPLKAKDALALLEKATIFERLIMGQPTSRDEHEVKADISALSPEEAEQFALLLGKVNLAS